MSSTADDDTDERAWNAAGKRHVTGSAGYMMDKMGARYKNDHGRYKPVDEMLKEKVGD